MIFRAYQDGMDIDEWRPGRYYSEELLDAYTKATRVGDPKLRAEAYYQRAMVHSTFGRYSAARSDFNQSCTIGGQEFCLKSGDELAAIAKHTPPSKVVRLRSPPKTYSPYMSNLAMGPMPPPACA